MSGDLPRVLLVTKGLDLGGIERIVVDLAIGLSRRGADVDVAVVNDRRSRLAEPIHGAGIQVIELGGTDRVGFRAAIRLARLVRSGGYDVVHVHGPLPAVVVRCVPSRAAVVTTSHTMWTSLRRVTRVLWWVTARRDAATLAVSSAVVESLPRRISARTSVMPHGLDLQAIGRAVASARQGFDEALPDDDSPEPRRNGFVEAPDRVVTAICVASHRDVKNYPNLLRAIAAARGDAPHVRLVAVGDGPELERHRQLADVLGISDVVSFEPATAEVIERMAAADLLVVASDFEGQPLVVMEAMAVGLPVVATAVGRVPELLGPSEGRIVPPGDSEALGAAIVELVNDPQLRRRLGERARSVSGSWTLDDVVEAHLALYAALNRAVR